MKTFLETIFIEKDPSHFIEVRYFTSQGVEQKFVKTCQEVVEFVNTLPKDINVFYGAVPRTSQSGREENVVQEWNWIFADYDNKSGDADARLKFIQKAKMHKPNIIVSSGGGFHVYWKVKNASIDLLRTNKERLAQYLTTDPSVVDAARIMRLPDTFNCKYEPNKLVGYKLNHTDETDLSWLPDFTAVEKAEYIKTKHLDIYEALTKMDDGNRNPTLNRICGKCFGRGDSLETVKLAIFSFMDANKKWTKNELNEKASLARDMDRWFKDYFIDKNKISGDVLTAEQKNLMMKPFYQANSPDAMMRVLESAKEKLKDAVTNIPTEFIEVNQKFLSQVNEESITPFKTGNSEIDEAQIFYSPSLTMLCGLTGNGKTTILFDLIHRFIENNKDIKILFLGAKSETSTQELSIRAKAINLLGFSLKIFSRFDDIQKDFGKILDDYHDKENKYPDIVLVDTFEKLDQRTENYNLKMNAEKLNEMSKEYNICILATSQLSSPYIKALKKQPVYFPIMCGQGGLDVVSNCDNFITVCRKIEKSDLTETHNNNFFFAKLRRYEAQHLVGSYLKVNYNFETRRLEWNSANVISPMEEK